MSSFGMQIEYLLNTGNLVSNNTLDLSQNTGFTVVAEKLNFFRWAPTSLISHGQCVSLLEEDGHSKPGMAAKHAPQQSKKVPRAI